MTKTELDAFLVDYESLLEQHKIAIVSCACCDGIWMQDRQTWRDDKMPPVSQYTEELYTDRYGDPYVFDEDEAKGER